ncbi:hypothetical protein GH714_040858 [Hevea brasiliensis]|uniref:Two-component response regulator-like APRR1 n=1 Tax=Hevea brasiliensis TaxID=3981 RepID=A0A6A6MV61_HEVBR|nr:hypothetical protein GH714_040858 [Hevea brasiliensis]
MEGKEQNINKESGGGVGNSKSGDGVIDRSKVRILLCDNNTRSSEEVFTLLLKCSYQVTSVRSARQVIDALNADGPDIDIILAEVDLPMNKGMKMLKYITRDKELRRIPVIMMSAQDEVPIVVKCLRLGAADYLVKPLRTNELLNLWTHMWRRRRMLGLVEKNILNYEFDLVASDPSDANTNSTTLFSDDTDDKSRRYINPEMGVSIHQENESVAAATAATTSAAVAAAPASATAVEPLPSNPMEYRPDVPGISDRRIGQLPSGPKKSELKIGKSSAFFTYVKSSTIKNNSQGFACIEYGAAQNLRLEEKVQACGRQVVIDAQLHENGEIWESYSQDDFHSSSSIPDSLSLERSCTPPMSRKFPPRNFKDEKCPQVLMHSRNELQYDASGISSQSVYPFYMSGVVNQVIMPSSAQLYQKNMHELQSNAPSAMLPQYNHLPQCSPHKRAALLKFRQKRKERCFDKKIRYVNRKKLAERRPRVRGQFVRQDPKVSKSLCIGDAFSIEDVWKSYQGIDDV